MEKLSSDTGYFKKPVEINRGIVSIGRSGDRLPIQIFFSKLVLDGRKVVEKKIVKNLQSKKIGFSYSKIVKV